MRTQFSGKPLFFVLVIGAIGAASVALGFGTHALSKGQAQEPAPAIVKASVTDAKPAQPGVRDRGTASAEALAGPNSWKRSPSLTDF